MKSLPSLCIAALAATALTGCGLINRLMTRHPSGEPITTNSPQLVGRIASLPADKRFVLIESYGKWNIASNSILTTRGPENRSANLLVTGEKLDQFAAADLKSGTLAVGDAVYFHLEPKTTSPQVPSQPVDNQPKTSP